jgi:DNA-binding CsgD family transcriptional regulator
MTMPTTKTDEARAESNPWGLTAKQCAALRMICEHGCTKRAVAATEIDGRTIEHHILTARRKLGYFGNDTRLYLDWDRWVRGVVP